MPLTADGGIGVGAVEAAASAGTEVPAADPWRVVQNHFDPARAAHDAAIYCLANGTLGVRSSFEEQIAPGDGSYLAEVWERSSIQYHERHSGFAQTTDTRVPVADGTHIAIRLGGQAVNFDEGEALDFERALDLCAGSVSRRLRWRTSAGATIEIAAERIVPFAHAALLCIRFRVASIDYAGSIQLESSIRGARRATAQGDDPRIGAGAGDRMTTRAVGADTQVASMLQSTRVSGITVACAQRHRIHGDVLALASSETDADSARQVFDGTLAPGGSVALDKFVAYAWTQGAAKTEQALLDEVALELSTADALGFGAIAQSQRDGLEAYWRDADLAIDGDAQIEQTLRFNLFHVLQSTGRGGRTSTAAKGLTGEGYEGHYFWDTEAFVLPVLALTAPALARGMLEYRLRTLGHARTHARELNHSRGALYAWRTISGDECSAYYPGGSAQYHINAAIAYAIRLYVDASGDQAFLVEGGAEVLFETARIWLDIGHFNARRNGAFCIHEVTGPDEYTALVDNNYYTNRMAQAHLRHAVKVAGWFAAEHAAGYAGLCARIGLADEEIEDWSLAAETMYLPSDERYGVFPQDDTFLDKPVWNFKATPADRYPLLLHYHPMTIYRHQVCKQADVVLALVLAGEGIDRERKRRNFDYYERVTVHDSTLSASTFCVLASEVGYADKAYRYFLDTARVDLDDLHGNTHHGVHMAAMAGSWLGLVWGFAGLRIVAGRLTFAPTLPAVWQGYRFGMVWQGRRLQLKVDAAGVRYTLLAGEALEIEHDGSRVRLVVDAPCVRPLAYSGEAEPSRGVVFPQPFKALIFDLDGVVTDTARLHYIAWKRLADEIGVPFDEQVNERLKGVDRDASLEIILERATRVFTVAEKRELAERKNGYYRAGLSDVGPQQLLPGALDVLRAARAAGLRTGLASASKNAALILERLGIAGLFDYVADANRIARAKPDPEIFLKVAHELGVAAGDCLGIEDAAAGVAAIKAAGMAALGIGDAVALVQADAVLPGLAGFRIEDFVSPPVAV
ncbi:MAG: beta-phosphoglucomutase [Dokdonella sp.]